MGDCADKLDIAIALLNLQGPVSMEDRASALWRSPKVASGRLGTMTVISQDGATVSQAITYCDNLIDSPTGDYERAKTIADTINNGQVVTAGLIPLSTAQIAYQRGLAQRSFRVSAPGGGSRTFSFTMGESGPVRLHVFDVAGRLVAKLLDREGRQPLDRLARRDEAELRGAGLSRPPRDPVRGEDAQVVQLAGVGRAGGAGMGWWVWGWQGVVRPGTMEVCI
jgi:hypothetical protein